LAVVKRVVSEKTDDAEKQYIYSYQYPNNNIYQSIALIRVHRSEPILKHFDESISAIFARSPQ
jgi:hypothetical protein